MKKLLILSVALLGVSAPAFAMTEAECTTLWTQADANGDGNLNAAENERYLAMLRIGNKTLPPGNMFDSATFRENCISGSFTNAAVEEGAPFAGANSFTEEQARDRAIAAGHTGVSALMKDENGIWRGTASMNGATTNIAIDFKGNVVTSK